MPTERFYRLPETKRHMILEAAKKEFARVPYEKASINQMIHNADISRGSFYTYFEDKQDVLRCIFEEGREQFEAVCKKTLEENHGDYLNLLEQLFEYFVNVLRRTKETLDMVRNVFSYQENTKIFGIGDFPEPNSDLGGDDSILWIMENVDRSLLRWNDVEHFKALTALGTAALLLSIKRYYECPEKLEQIREAYHTALEMLRLGAYQYQEESKN